MDKRILVLGALFLTSCGSEWERQYACTVNGNSCDSEAKASPVPGPQGAQGEPGKQGDTGAAGSAGESCSVQAAVNGALITCGGNSVLVLNGLNGSDGQDGADGQDGQDAPPTAYSVVELIDPCGDKPGKFDEVFLRLANGMLVASFSDNQNGLNTRFSVLTPGSYQTTDGTGCFFSVDANLNLYNEHY